MSEVRDRGVEIDDPDNFSSTQRLKHIYDARRQLRDMRTKAAANRSRAPRKAVTHYRTGVESYLLELDTLMRRHPPGPELLHDRVFGTVTVEPPGRWESKRSGAYYVEPNLGTGNSNLKVESLPEPKQVEMRGLLSLLDRPSPIEEEFEFRLMNSLGDGSTKTLTATVEVSWRTLNRMVSAMNEFVSDLGIGLDVNDENEWKI